MKIKRFFAPDMRQAIRQVREMQGPDAVILSSRPVNGGIEIISAIDFDQNLVSELAERTSTGTAFARTPRSEPALLADEPDEAPPDPGQAAIGDAGDAVPNSASARQIVWAQDPAIAELQRELKSMKSLLQEELSQLAWSDFSRREPLRAQLINHLLKIGLETGLARVLATMVNQFDSPERAWHQALLHLVDRVRVDDDAIIGHGGVIALVGATGVGKTTTVAKLAARYALRHGPRRVALVTTDAYRVGAQKQLLTYGSILDVPVHVVNNEHELPDMLARLSHYGLVLIDTAGMSQRDLRISRQLAGLEAIGSVRNYLVASANTQRSVLDEVVRAFKPARLSGCIITKVDEALSLGDALSVAIKYDLPLAYLADGQQVPEDLKPARAQRVVNLAVALARQHQQPRQDLPEAMSLPAGARAQG